MRGLLVGYGSAGRRHLAHFHALGVTDWTVVRSGRGTLAFQPPCAVRVVPDLEAAFALGHHDFAVVANPSAFHVATATACIGAGCHLLIEKPLATSLDALGAIEHAVRAADRRVLVGFQFRGHPAVDRIAGLVRDGRIGRVLRAELSWGEYLPDWHPWESYRAGYAARVELGGGVHHTLCHPVDLALRWFGPPRAVTADLVCNGPLGLEVAESAEAWLEWDGGLRAVIHLDYWRRPGGLRVELLGTDGSLEWDYPAGTLRVRDSAGNLPIDEPLPGVAEREALFAEQARHFLAVVAGAEPPRSSLRDGMDAARVTLGMEASARRRCTLHLADHP